MSSKSISDFLSGKPQPAIELFNTFVDTFQTIGIIEVSAAKTMIGISNDHKRIAWVTQFGKNFLHVVFPFKQPYPDNLCFTKIAQVPGTTQFNHHFRMLYAGDLNEEVIGFMRVAYNEED